MERVPGLVQECLVVVQPALRAGDQVDDLGWVGCDHARARRLLRAVLEVEPDVAVGLDVEAEPRQRRQAHGDGLLARVDRVERRQAAQVVDVERARLLVALGPEQALEPALAQPRVGTVHGFARRPEDALDFDEGDLLLLLAAVDRVGIARELALEPVVVADQLEPLVVEPGRAIEMAPPQLVPVAVVREHGEPRGGRAQRHLLSLPLHAGREDRVLELVVALGQLGGDDAGLAGLAQPVEPLTVAVVRALLLVAECGELVAREEIGVAGDDRRLLGDLLLADADRPAFLGPLEEVLPELRLELGGAEDRRRAAHDATTLDDRRHIPRPSGTAQTKAGALIRRRVWATSRRPRNVRSSIEPSGQARRRPRGRGPCRRAARA
jgi:hypothetical protein